MSEIKSIGKINEVRGLSVKATLFKLLPPYLTFKGKREVSPRINGFVKTYVGLDLVICQVIGELSNSAHDSSVDPSFSLELKVIGYINEKGRFIQGLRMLPIVDANIYLLEESDYDSLNFSGGSLDYKLEIGCDLFDDSKRVFVDPDKLMPTHIGIFGNTGSGKSNTLAKLLSEYARCIEKAGSNRAKFLILDFNSEYGNDAICSQEKKKVYRLSTKAKNGRDKVPLDVDSLTDEDFISLMQASEKTQAPLIKTAYRSFEENRKCAKDELDEIYSRWIRRLIALGKHNIVNSVRYRLEHCFRGLDKLRYHSKNEKFYIPGNPDEYFNGDVDSAALKTFVADVPSNPIDLFLFELFRAASVEEENGTNYAFISPLLARATRVIRDLKKLFDFNKQIKDIFDCKNVCVLQMAECNSDAQAIVCSLIGNIVFERVSSKKKDRFAPQVINIVVDEAHRILSEEKDNETILSVYEKIVKEGRKFGVFLLIASQRPSDISQTIISQLHNYFVHKLVNPQDIDRISKAVAYMDADALKLMTILAPGECIVSGTAFQTPRFIYVEQPKEEQRPQSDDIVLFNADNALLKKRPLEKDELSNDEEE